MAKAWWMILLGRKSTLSLFDMFYDATIPTISEALEPTITCAFSEATSLGLHLLGLTVSWRWGLPGGRDHSTRFSPFLEQNGVYLWRSYPLDTRYCSCPVTCRVPPPQARMPGGPTLFLSFRILEAEGVSVHSCPACLPWRPPPATLPCTATQWDSGAISALPPSLSILGGLDGRYLGGLWEPARIYAILRWEVGTLTSFCHLPTGPCGVPLLCRFSLGGACIWKQGWVSWNMGDCLPTGGHWGGEDYHRQT